MTPVEIPGARAVRRLPLIGAAEVPEPDAHRRNSAWRMNGDAAMRQGLPGSVFQALRGGQRDALAIGIFMPVTSPVKKSGQRPRNLPCVYVEAFIAGKVDTRHQYRILFLEPGECFVVIFNLLRGHARLIGSSGIGSLGGSSKQGRGTAGAQIVSSTAVSPRDDRCGCRRSRPARPHRRGAGHGRRTGRAGARHKAGLDKRRYGGARLLPVESGQARGRGQGDVWAGMQAEQANTRAAVGSS